MSTLVDFSGFETSENFKLAEAEEGIAAIMANCIITSTPIPKFNENFILKCFQDKTNNVFRSFMEFADSNKVIVGGYTQFDRLPPNAEDIDFLKFRDVSAGGNRIIELCLEATTGDLLIKDSTDTEVASVSAPFSIDTWHEVELMFERESTGSAELFIDSASVATVASADFEDVTHANDMHLQLRGQGGNPLAQPTFVFFNSYYVLNDCTDSGDLIGEFKVERFQANLTGVTPDSGDDLDSGDLKAISDGLDTSAATRYSTSTRHDGYVRMDDHPDDGPAGKVGAERTIHGAKWTWWGSNVPGGTGQYIFIYGLNSPLSGDIITTDDAGVNLNPGKPWNIVQDVNQPSSNRVPTFEDDFIIGFGSKGVGRSASADFREGWCFLLTSPPKTTTHIRGGHIRGGHWR